MHNPSLEPITLTRVNLQSVGPVTSYALRNDSRPFDVTIAPRLAERPQQPVITVR